MSRLAEQGEAHSLAGAPTSYPWFDWLRFVLASVVVIGHAGYTLLPFLTGELAVQVFFALSGWLIGGILLSTTPEGLPRFFFNRATRIWIPYALAIVLLYGVAAAKEGIDFFWFKYLVLDVTFTHQIFTVFPAAHFEMPMAGSGNQFWSIAVEEQFYLLAPLVMIFMPGGRTARLWAAVAVVAAVLHMNALPISLGVIAAIVHQRTGFADIPTWRAAAFVMAIATALAMSFDVDSPMVAALFSIAVVVAVASRGHRGAVAVVAGGLSFPLYLNHWIGVFAVHAMEKRLGAVPFPVFVIAQYAVNIGLALGLYWAIDRNIQLYRNRWFTPERGRALAITAYVLVGTGMVAGTLMNRFGPHG